MGQGDHRRSQRFFFGSNRRLWGLFLFALLITSGSYMLIFNRPDLNEEQLLVQRLLELQVRLQHLDLMHHTRLEEADLLFKELRQLMKTRETDNAYSSAHHGSNSQMQKHNISASLTTGDASLPSQHHQVLRSPTVYSFLPHLMNDPLSLQPAYTLSRNRSGVSVVMGIPTVKRETRSYLIQTLHSLVESMDVQEAADSLIIVFVAEVDEANVHQIAGEIEEKFSDQVEAGLIEVISPPASYYPDLDKLPPTLGDPPERVRWRTKQNLDFAFLMMYAQPKGTYYVQLEDDILAKKNSVSIMKYYALQQANTNWLVLVFSQLGFIGKMIKSAELPWLIQFFLMFYNDKPVDWLLDHLIQTKVCRLDKDGKNCLEAKFKVWLTYNGSLFQHVGLHSSLKGKVQKLQDKKFGKVSSFYPHSNPAAEVKSSIVHYKDFSIQKAYEGKTFFWGYQPKIGDNITFTFEKPQHLKRYVFRSGNAERFEDSFNDTTVEVMPETSEIYPRESDYNVTADGFYVVGNFDELGSAEGRVDPKLNPVKVVRLNVHSNSENWVILSEIFLAVEDGK